MPGLRLYREQLPLLYPHTYAALQHLVMAMAECSKNAGKKTWFGRDKGTASLMKFNTQLRRTLFAMVMDGAAKEQDDAMVVVTALLEILQKFTLAWPAFTDAYSFASFYFSSDRKDAVIAVVDRMRGT